ncbi:MAG: DUF2911 domain-containing protein [Bacteroidota bacterium]
MKKFLALAFLIVAFSATQAQDDKKEMKFPTIDKSIMDMSYYPPRAVFRAFAKTDEEKAANQPVMRVVYSRPLKNGRDVFGGLVEYGKVWRLGANEATELTVVKPVSIGGKKLDVGRYSIHVVPTKDEWEIHIASELDAWGSYSFKPEEHTLATIKVPTAATPATVEAMSIMFEKSDDGAHMIVAWDDTMARVPFTF